MGCEEIPSVNEELAKGKYYSNRVNVIWTVGLWHMEQGVAYTAQLSKHNRLLWPCKIILTPFTMRAVSSAYAWCVYLN